MIVYNTFWVELRENYSGYPTSGLLFLGMGAVGLTLLLSLALSLNSRAPHDNIVHTVKE